jgi:hypothetical protein
MIGDKLLGMPKIMGEAKQIYIELELQYDMRDTNFFDNAVRLVKMNNELFDKQHNITWLQERIDIINSLSRR